MKEIEKNSRVPHALTPRRIEVFLAELRKTGSLAAAARKASPWSTGKRGGLSTFTDLIKKDPEFAAACEEAKGYALGRVESKITALSIDGDTRPIFQGGIQVGEEVRHYPGLLLRLAERLDRKWASQEHIQVEGRHGVIIVNAPASSSDDWSRKVADRAIDVTPGDSQSTSGATPTPPVQPPSDPAPSSQ